MTRGGGLPEISSERVPAATLRLPRSGCHTLAATLGHGARRRVLVQPQKKSAPEGAQSTGVEKT